jgi:hypothetical protein
MTQSRPPLVVNIVLFLLLLYVGIYLATIDPPNNVPTLISRAMAGRSRYHRAGPEWLDLLFAPLQSIDRKVRPGTWEPSQGVGKPSGARHLPVITP